MPTSTGLRKDYHGIMAASIFKLAGQINVLNNSRLAIKKIKEDDVYSIPADPANIYACSHTAMEDFRDRELGVRAAEGFVRMTGEGIGILTL